MKNLLMSSLLLLSISCAKIEQGEVGIVSSFDGTIQNKAVTSGFELVVFDSIEIADISENVVTLENIPARDSENVALSDLDVHVSYRVNPEGVVEYYKKTKTLDQVQLPNGTVDVLVGYHIVKREADNNIQKTIAAYKSEDIMTNRTIIEKAIRDTLNKDLSERFPKTFEITNVNLNAIKLNANIEEAIQTIQIVKNNRLKIQAEKEQVLAKKELLEAELKAKQEVASKYGMTTKEYLELEIKKDFNDAIRGGNVNIHVTR